MASEDTAGAAASPSATEKGSIPASDIVVRNKNEILVLLAVGKVAALKKWKGKMLSENPPKEEFDKVLHETLVYATAVFGIIRPAHQQCYRLADELAEAIVEMRNHLGEEILPLSKEHFFSRGMFETFGKTLVSRQYYEPIPFYGPPRKVGPNPMEILKFYEWQYIDKPPKDVGPGTPVNCMYYLEKGIPEITGESFYVLGMTAPGMHASLETYHGERPSFYALEEAIVKRIQDNEQGNNPGFAAASFYERR